MYVFISGGITGVENYRGKFLKREKQLKQLGHRVCNPVTVGERLKATLGREPTYDEYLAEDLKCLEKCDAINHLDGWESSNGAKIEHEYAASHNKIIMKVKFLNPRW